MRTKVVTTIFLFLVLIIIIFVWKIFYAPRTSGSAKSANNPIFQATPFPISKPRYNISSGNIPDIPLKLPAGFVIHVFASNLGNPRTMLFSPGGTLLVSNPASNSVIALPDKNNKGTADYEKTIISRENHVHGLAFFNGFLFLADVDKVVRYKWNEKSLTASFDKTLFPLPENNDHNNRSMIFDSKGKLYVSIGSTCNICFESSPFSGTVIVSDFDGNNPRVFAKGLRDAAFLAFNPKTQELWGTEMGRDYLGDNLPPDEINIIRLGKDYGYPFCYGDRVHDNTLDPNYLHSCDSTEPPLFSVPAHSAPLGLVFIQSNQFPAEWQNDLLVSYHGSWDRSVATGYKVVHLKVHGNSIVSSDDFLTEFLQGTKGSDSLGRPVGLIFDNLGNLYLSDDKSGNIYIIQKSN